jgi:hypothetical protein
MTLRRRLGIAALLALPVLVIYGLGRYYSPDIITLIVEQSLIEKAPPGTNPEVVTARFHRLMAGCATHDAKMQTLLQLSQYLEKVQEISVPELESLLQGILPGSTRPVS